METKYCIFGNIPSKANQYEISIKKGKPSFRKKDHIKAYEDSFLAQIWPEVDFTFESAEDLPETKMIQGRFELLDVHVYYKNSVHDLDNAFKTLLDCCQLAKLVKNDKDCYHIGHAYKHIDKENPRVEFTLRELCL